MCTHTPWYIHLHPEIYHGGITRGMCNGEENENTEERKVRESSGRGMYIIYIYIYIYIYINCLNDVGVEVWSKFRPNFDTPSVEASTKLRPNFDTPSVEVWSKFARYINEIHSKFDKMSTKLRHQTSTKLRTSTLGGRSLVEISTKLRHHIVQNRLFYLNK